MADKVIFTGKVDEFFDYKLGKLEYRTVRFETETLNTGQLSRQRSGQLYRRRGALYPNNRAQAFQFGTQPKTVISRIFVRMDRGAANLSTPSTTSAMGTFTPVQETCRPTIQCDIRRQTVAEYKYYDMDKVIESALATVCNNTIH